MKVALQFGIGYGSVQNYTDRVLAAINDKAFKSSALQWASPRARAEAMEWVERETCSAWRNGWLMVDGTLVPLYRRPGFFGNNFFDRKANYSTAVQIISLPNLRIIDYSVGRPGSTHDSTGWRDTWIYQRRDGLLRDGEWIWADSAYPLTKWCQSPYVKPDKLLPDNAAFNYHLSSIRIRSEHAIGYVKGRWSSLKGLRVAVDDEKGLQFASLWITGCILLHNFALEHEQQHGQDFNHDHFYRSGRRYSRRMREFEKEWRDTEEDWRADREAEADEDVALLEGRIKRKKLKEELFAELGIAPMDVD
ncbi:unnamed protein product [Peniophora sp. CBMAI 1063]|nr:unnamed protein product [Peniophora sp. CBMAI 1063]